MNRRGKRIVGVGLVVGLVVLLTFIFTLFQPFAGSSNGTPVRVAIPPGSSVSQVGDLLEKAGVIDNSMLFSLRARIDGDGGSIRAGGITLRTGMSYSEALGALTTAPASAAVKAVTIPEGLARGQVAPLVSARGVAGNYLAASDSSPLLTPTSYGAPSGASLEGFLFPSTYELKIPATSRELVADQLKAFKTQFAGVDLAYAKSKNLTPFDVVTIASMIERETAAAADRPLISAVIWNRLHQGIPLGIDATSRYEFNNWTRPLLQSQLESSSPYNTRLHKGLPPGPVGNPGLASLKAAARPARSNYIYYVVKPWTCGEHSFSTTQTKFNADVAAYNAARDSNQGKAPTKCP